MTSTNFPSSSLPTIQEASRNAAEHDERAELLRLLTSLKRIEERLTVVEVILNDAEAKPTKKEDIEEEPMENENIFFIVPHIASDFKMIEGQSLPIPQLTEVFSSWSESLYAAAMLNRPHLRGRKKLQAHMWNSLEICQSLLRAVQAHLKK